MAKMKFDDWIAELDEDVIQGQYGYEPGEFAVYPDEWKPMWRKGLSPRDAFERAMKAYGDARREEERLKQENWERIQASEAKYAAGPLIEG